MKALIIIWLLFSPVLALGQVPAVSIKASLEKIRAQLMAEATKRHYEVKENTETKLVIQGKSEKRAEWKYGLILTRVGSIPDQRIVYRFTTQNEIVTIEATTELVAGEATGKFEKGEKALKKQLAALKKKLEQAEGTR